MDIFVYGTLLIPELTEALLGYKPNKKAAILKHHLPVTLLTEQGETAYPVLKQEKNATTNGAILINLSDRDLKILQLYEGDEYVLKDNLVSIENKTVKVSVFMPVDTLQKRHGNLWSIAAFKQYHLKEYINKEIPDLLKNTNSIE